MSRPKIFGFCKAGCQWETVHRDEFLQSASIVKQYAADGEFLLEVGKKYKIAKTVKNATAWGFTVSVEFHTDDALQTGYACDITFPACTKYDKYLTVRILDVVLQETQNEYGAYNIVIVAEVNGQIKEYETGNDTYNPNIIYAIDSVTVVGATECYLVNEDANIVFDTSGEDGKDGVGIKSIEKTATEGLIDTYTITLTDGKTYTFNVTNGGNAEAIEARLQALEKWMAGDNYQNIAITTFYASKSTYEMGETVTSVTLNWNTNKIPTALTLDGNTIDVTKKSETVTDFVNMNSQKKSWTLTATGENGETDTKTAEISFLNGVYYGEAEEPAEYNSEFILGLTKTLRSTYISSFLADAGEGKYIYYCLPARMGERSFKVGGFDGGFSLVATIDFTNSKGYTESYYIYRSDNAALGSTSVTVS